MEKKELVSIITPCYNSEKFIAQTIESVLSQTYSNWEMLIVDDCSRDGSAEIIKGFCKRDSRIKYYRTEYSSGTPTLPRNIAIKEAKGRFISFLDSDDVWLPTKLEEELPLFYKTEVAIVYSNYEKIAADGKRNQRIIVAPSEVTYHKLLKENVIGCLTAVYDVQKIGKVFFQKVGHEDFVMWLSILRKGFIAQNTNTVTALYRVNEVSVSSNKLRAFRWTWNIYRKIENLSFFYSSFCFLNYAIRTTLKYLK